MKTLKRITNWTIWSLAALYLIVIVLLHVPAVQGFIGSEVSQAIGTKLGTKVRCGRLDIGFFNRLIIDDVDIYDQKGKLMLHASRLSAKLSVYQLMHGKIAISSAQLFGLNASLYKENETTKPNFQFALDSLASKDTTQHTPLDLRINSLIIRHGAIRYDQYDSPLTHDRLNPHHLAIKDISAHVMLHELTDSAIGVSLKKLSLREASGFDLRQLELKFHADNRHATLRNFLLRLPRTKLMTDSVSVSYAFLNGKLAQPSLRFSGSLQGDMTPSDIKSLVPAMSNFTTPVSMSAEFSGTSTTLHLLALNLKSTSEGIDLTANGTVSNWNNPHWHVNIQNLNLSAGTIQFVAKNLQGKELQIPEEITRLGDVHYRGEVGGAGKALSVRGILQTDAGNADIGLGLNGQKFSARLQTSGMDMGRILANNDFGSVATNIDAEGVFPNDIKTKGKVSQFVYKSYTYNNIAIDGTYKNQTFDGYLGIDDPNGEIQLQGRFTTHLEQPSANLTASIRHFSPAAMNITHQWKDAVFDADINADFSGKTLNTANGTLDITNFSISSAETNYQLERLHIAADNQDGEHFVRLQSDFADVAVRGHYDYKTIAQSVTNFIGSKLPTIPGLPKTTASKDNNFTITATVNRTDWLSMLLDIPVSLEEPMYLYGRLNDKEQKLNLECSIPSITYDGTRYRDTRISLTTPSDTLHANISLQKVMDNGRRFSWEVKANAVDNRLSSIIRFSNNSRHAFKGILDAEAQFFNNEKGKPTAHINVHPSEILVNDTVWHVQPSDIVYSKGHLIVDHFAIEHNKQHLIVSGLATNSAEDSLTVDLQDIDVNYITNLVNFHAVEFGGLATGRACVTSAFNNPSAYADLHVKHFTFEDGRMGLLHARVDWNKEEKQIDITASADDGPTAKTLIMGYVSPAHNYIDLGITALNTRLEFLESFCGSFMCNVDARANGRLRVFGPLDHINLTGQAVADGQLDISSLNTTYWLRNDTVRLIPNEIIFRGDTIYDRDNHRGIVSGSLYHDYLKNLSYDLNIQAHNLLAYDFKDYGGDTFFGTVWATGNCAIHGKSGEIVMDINATPGSGSFIEYNASAPDAIANQSFIEWHDMTEKNSIPPTTDAIPTDSIDNEDEYEEPDIPSDLRLNFLINCTPEATLRLLMDKSSGDYIALNGSGTIRATYYNKGSFDMFGTYLVDHGIYKLTIQNIIKKDFQFQQGGTIVFGGDPYNAALNLQALYTVNGVPLSDLNIGRSFTNNNVRVDCMMNITGNPNEPKVDFDLDLPTVNSDAKQMVRSIINGQEEMNQQVIYLLSIGRFYTQNPNNAAEENAQQSQTSLAMQSLLSGTISQQINNVLSSVINNNHWNFGANISTGDEGWNNAEYEGLVSGRMLNNRLLINGQFGYRDNANATTSFIGDFDIRYLLFPSGNLAINVYNQTNDRYFTRNSLNTQGLGIVMKKDFNGWRDLLGWNRKRKKR